MTDGPTLPSVCYTQTSMCLSPAYGPEIVHLDSSMKIECRQWQMFQTWWCPLTAAPLMHYSELRATCRLAKGRRWWYALTGDVQCDELAGILTKGLIDRNLLARIIVSKYWSSWGMEIFWRWPRGRWLGDPVCFTSVKILLMAPFVTRKIPSKMNLSAPFTSELNNELQ